MNILDRIVAEKQREVARLRKTRPIEAVAAFALLREDFRDFKSVLCRKDGTALIAEIKKASPSAGVICENFDPVAIAHAYEKAGASACSVLTDKKFFQGRFSFLSAVRDSVHIPVLRKDFIIDEYQIYESAVGGADAILLIMAILDLERVKKFLAVAKQCQLAALVEIHDEAEKEIALKAGAEIIGINNRNLKDFSVSLATTEKLAKGIAGQFVLVAESGIQTRADVERVRAAGVDAILVGESLMKSENISAKVGELLGRDVEAPPTLKAER
jgi:indole-3-glycerol phosphate synthase